MKKKDVVSLLIAVVLLVLPVAVYSQDIKTVPFDEKYKDQSCIFLLYDVSVELKDDWSYVTKEHKKLKIQNEDGKTMGDVPILYDRSREKVSNISAYTITPDGKRHKYAKIQDMRVFEGFDMYSDERVKIINMPEANIGSIIEFEYTKTTSRDQIKNQFWHVTDLINTIPIKELNLTFVFPKKLDIKYKEFNLKRKPAITETDKKITYAWRLKDVEIRPEEDSYTPPPNLENIEDGVEFSSIKSWKDISDWYYGLIEKNMRATGQMREVAQGLIAGKSTVKDKARAILEYIQDNFRYVSMSFGDNALEPHPTDEVFKNKYGDCKDLSLLSVYMLKEAGVKSNIALFNTEYSINDPQYDLPIPTLFDHVIVEVVDIEGNFYIDPVLNGYDIGEYPPSYQMGYTFVITKDGGKFGRFPVFDIKRSYTKLEQKISIKEDGSAAIEGKSLFGLDFSINMRRMWKNATQEQKDIFMRDLDYKLTQNGVMEMHKFGGIDSRYGPITSTYRLTKPGAYAITDGMLIIDFAGFENNSSLAKKDRDKPIFFPTNSLDESTYIYNIPEGFKLSHIPKNIDMDIGFYNYKRTFRKFGSGVMVNVTELCRRKELPKSDYQKLKDFDNKMSRETKQRIIFRKAKKEWSPRLWLKNLLLKAAEKL